MEELIAELEQMASPDEIENISRFYRGGDPDTTVMGVQIGQIFPVANKYTPLPLEKVQKMLDDNRYEFRMAAMAILDFKTQQKSINEGDRQKLYECHIRKHDRINSWDLADRAAPRVVGEHLFSNDRRRLDALAQSPGPHRRRTAIVATYAFIKRGEIEDAFRIATILAGDRGEYVQKAVASWTREAGKSDAAALEDFLRINKSRSPRTTITNASKPPPLEIRKSLMS
ncbi:MAG: DNA alkylation repair protein [Pseudomonadota bacterium]